MHPAVAHPTKRPHVSKSSRQLLDEIIEHQAREKLRAKIQRLIDKWSPILGVHVHDWKIRRMRSYWGSTDPATGRITFDAKLADMSPAFLQVTVVHELVHLRVGGHTPKFYEIMDRSVPGWRRLHGRYAGRMTPQS